MPGIGKRTSERIIVELREKVAGALEEEVALAGAEDGDARSLARDGLVNLGYAPLEAEQLLDGRRGRRARGAGRRRRCARPPRRGTPHERARPTSAPTGSARPGSSEEPVPVDAEVRVHDARAEAPDEDLDRSLRPPTLADFVNQTQVTEQLAIFIEAAQAAAASRSTTSCSPARPGLGKTSLAHIVAAELGVPMVQTAGPALERKADVASFLTALEPGSVFFIDEIHRLGRAVEETLYPAMEDGELPVVLGQGAGARTVTLPLPPFTLVGATTRVRAADDAAARPLRRLPPPRALQRRAPGADRRALGRDPRGRDRRRGRADDRLPLARDAAGRQPAAEAGPGLRPGEGDAARSAPTVAAGALEMLEVDAGGLDRSDRALLDTVATKFGGGPVGLSTLAIAIGEEQDTIEDVLEPYLLQQGLLKRTPRGRVLTQRAYDHLGLPAPEGAASLF